MALALLSLGLAPVAREGTDVVMYHVNPERFGPVPVNMDTADASGDLFFELMQVLTVPLACTDKNVTRRPFNCDNPEAVDPTDVVNKITITTYADTSGSNSSGYAMCNIGRNGTDGMGHVCKNETYCCFCFGDTSKAHHWPPPSVDCNTTIGVANLYDNHGGNHSHHWGPPCQTDYDCWSERAGSKLTPDNPGYWYAERESSLRSRAPGCWCWSGR